MCNQFANRVSYRAYVETLGRLGMPLVSPAPHHAPNLEPRDAIKPTDKAPVLRPVSGGLELTELRWGLIPGTYKGTLKDWKYLTTNARAETVATTQTYREAFKSRRCLVPVSRFYEWTGEKGRKTKWSFTRSDGEWFCFAGLWDKAATKDGAIESFSFLTTEAGPDVAPYHNRQPIILERNQYAGWLDLTLPLSDIIKPQKGILIAEG